MQPQQIVLLLASTITVFGAPVDQPALNQNSPLQAREFPVMVGGHRVTKDGPVSFHDVIDVDNYAINATNAHLASKTCDKSNHLVCGRKHSARNTSCERLIDALDRARNETVDAVPRQVCYWGEGNGHEVCCVSWAEPIPYVKKYELIDAVKRITRECTSNGISGRIEGYNLFGKCNTVCVADRGTHCE